jgi:hypothetical protein
MAEKLIGSWLVAGLLLLALLFMSVVTDTRLAAQQEEIAAAEPITPFANGSLLAAGENFYSR